MRSRKIQVSLRQPSPPEPRQRRANSGSGSAAEDFALWSTEVAATYPKHYPNIRSLSMGSLLKKKKKKKIGLKTIRSVLDQPALVDKDNLLPRSGPFCRICNYYYYYIIFFKKIIW